MPSASIIITQDSVAGQAGRSRDDLEPSLAVTLTNADNQGVYSHRWLLLDQPSGSDISLSGSTSAVCTFTPVERGTYRIQLSVNEGNRAGQVQTVLCAIRNTDGTRYFAYGEQGEEINWDVDGAENERGRVPDLELWMDSIAAVSGSAISEAGHAARSVIGRSANSVGDAADIAGAGAGSVLHDNGTTVAFRTLPTILVGATPRIIDTETTAFDTATAGVTTAQSVLSYTLPGGAFANGTILRCKLRFRLSNNNNGNIHTFAYAINFGGSPIYQPSSAHSYTGATAFVERPGELNFDLLIRSQTEQVLTGTWSVWDGGLAPTTGFGNFLTTEANAEAHIEGRAAIDLASDRLLEVTVTNSNATPLLHWIRHFWIIEAL